MGIFQAEIEEQIKVNGDTMILKWRCNHCGDVLESNSKHRHEFDQCGCGKSFVDLEEHYMRQGGEVEVIERREM